MLKHRGKGARTKEPGGGVGEVGEGVPGPVGRQEGWGRQEKEPRDLWAGRRAGGGRGRSPGTCGPGGGLGEVGEGVPGPVGWEEGWWRQRKESRDLWAGRRAGGGRWRLMECHS